MAPSLKTFFSTPFSQKLSAANPPKGQVPTAEAPSLVDIDVCEPTAVPTKSKFSAKTAGIVAISVAAGGAITAATYGLVQAAPHIAAGASAFFANPHLVPALIGVAAGVGAALLGLAVIKLVQVVKQNRAEAREAAINNAILNEGWDPSQSNFDASSLRESRNLSNEAAPI